MNLFYQAPPGATAHPLECPTPRGRPTPPTIAYVSLEPARGAHASGWRWVVTQVSAEPLPGWWRVDLSLGAVRVGDRAMIDQPHKPARDQVATIAVRDDPGPLEDGDASLSAVSAYWLAP